MRSCAALLIKLFPCIALTRLSAKRPRRKCWCKGDTVAPFQRRAAFVLESEITTTTGSRKGRRPLWKSYQTRLRTCSPCHGSATAPSTCRSCSSASPSRSYACWSTDGLFRRCQSGFDDISLNGLSVNCSSIMSRSARGGDGAEFNLYEQLVTKCLESVLNMCLLLKSKTMGKPMVFGSDSR